MGSCQPPIPANEVERLQTLRGYRVLDTGPESVFDELTQVASRICNTPIALISLIDEIRQWLKSRVGLNTTEMPREIAFCAHALSQSDLLEVPDALDDARFATNPLVTGAPNIRFYAGAPLVAPNGCVLGTLCAIDYIPRRLTTAQRAALHALSRAVVAELELRKRMRELTSVVVERDIAHQQLKQANDELELKIAERTASLAATNRALEVEVEARTRAEACVRDLATRDPLTELPNRRLLVDLLQQQFALARREGVQVAVCFLDLDKFKVVNDRFGHQCGDLLLTEVAKRLTACVRKGDTVSRLGGDEFVISLYGLNSYQDAIPIAKKILLALKQPFEADCRTLNISGSLGISVFPADGEDVTTLIDHADEAMYKAKRAGKNAFHFFSAR
ncbi:MAG: diguanylate cyclase [Burkholderiales bacterium]|nr:diguanylate cyclase [Burkholderiales bacterium]